jgi:FKBP-type peptidyl-prolyl cis-trans isomerase FkpA/FKBP-type peptidyl-prolyl cis-trans isomerase FklB
MKTLINTLFALVILSSLTVISCAPKNYLSTKDLDGSMVESPQTQADIDRNKIIKFAKAAKLKGNFTSSGIFYVIDEPGEGLERPSEDSKVTAHYTGTLLNGKKFDSSYDRDEPLKFKPSQVIKGWQEAVRMLGKGGKGKFIIPSGLAYGEKAVGEIIPANANLVFDMELLDFKSE